MIELIPAGRLVQHIMLITANISEACEKISVPF